MIQRRSGAVLAGLALAGLAFGTGLVGGADADSPYPWLRGYESRQERIVEETAPADRDAPHRHEPPHGGQIVPTHAFVAELVPTDGAVTIWALDERWNPIRAADFELEGSFVPYGGRRVEARFERAEDSNGGTRWTAPFDRGGAPGFHATLRLSSAVATERLEILHDPYGVLARLGFTERLLAPEHPGFEPFQIRWGRGLVTELHCAACHAVAPDARAPNGAYPIALHPAHGTVGPRLDDAGARLRPEWLVAYLSEPWAVRPWIPARMPHWELTPAEALDITAYLATETSGAPEIERANRDLGGARVERGRAVWDQSQCATCHGGGANPTGQGAEAFGPPLEAMGPRLRPDWAYAWIADPQRIRPGSPMPSFFFSGGESLYERAEADAEAVASFVLSHRSAEFDRRGTAAEGRHGEGDARRGKAMIEARRCAACHVFGGIEPPGAPDAPSLGVPRDEVARTARALAGTAGSGSHRPALRLLPGEATAIAKYLATVRPAEAEKAPAADGNDAAADAAP